MYKNITLKEETRKKLLAGAALVASAVGTTFGRKGRNVIIQHPSPRVPAKITKDGVSVAREIRLEDEKENLGARSLIDVSLRLLEKVGDGTTTSILLAHAFYKNLLKYNLDSKQLKKFSKLIEDLIAKYKEISIPANDSKLLEGVAYIASNGDDEITDIVKECVEHTGDKGNILVNTSQNQVTHLSHAEGIYVPFGYANQNFANNKLKNVGHFENAYLVLVGETIQSLDRISYLLDELLKKSPETPIVIIAQGFAEDTMIGLLGNLQRGIIKIAAVSLDSSDQAADDLLQDISIITGTPRIGNKYNRPLGMNKNCVHLEELKVVENCHISDDSTIILPRNMDEKAVADHIAVLTERMNNTDNDQEKEYLSLRIGRLNQKVSIIKVGGLTKQLASEKKDRFEDSVCATMQALKHGVLPGGGTPLIMGWDYVMSELDAVHEDYEKVIIDSFEEVLGTLYTNSIWKNSKKWASLIAPGENKLDDPRGWKGLNLETEEVVNLFDARILDATAVITESLATASEISQLLYNTETMITCSKTIDYDAINDAPLPSMGR